jgi:carboxymethylenebutenolidase
MSMAAIGPAVVVSAGVGSGIGPDCEGRALLRSARIQETETSVIEQHLDSLVPPTVRDRRDFVRAAIGTGFAAATLPIAAQTVIRTDTNGLVAGTVTVPVGDFGMQAYRSMPAGQKDAPVVLVASEIFGVHEHIADLTRRLAKKGYYAIAPELFQRYGDAHAVTDIPKLIADIVSKASDAQVNGDLDACVAFARGEGADVSKLGITGFCWGGRATWVYAAHSPALKAGVAWYGAVERAFNPADKPALEMAPRIKAAMLGLYGGDDSGIPVAGVEKMRDAVKAAGNTKVDIVVYPGVPHAFNADYRPSYRKEAAEDGWNRMLAWFKTHGVG